MFLVTPRKAFLFNITSLLGKIISGTPNLAVTLFCGRHFYFKKGQKLKNCCRGEGDCADSPSRLCAVGHTAQNLILLFERQRKFQGNSEKLCHIL
jgi:hypothetical protein